MTQEVDDDQNQSERSQSRHRDTNTASSQLTQYPITALRMSESSSSKNLLPDGIKLKGEENYVAWKEVIEDIAVANRLRRYIHKKGKAPKYVDEFDKKADKTKLVVWLIWEARDSSIKIIIKLNIKSTPA